MPSKKKLELKDAFFPVELASVYVQEKKCADKQLDLFSKPGQIEIPGFKAVKRSSDGKVYAMVRDSYHLITNEDAYALGKTCFAQVFGKANADTMVFFNLRMPDSGSYCHIDFFAKDEDVYLNGDKNNKNEQWRIFLRISNSYNRTFALKFDIGFCRWICTNGVIFGNNSIEFKYRHDRSSEHIAADFKLKYKAMSVVKEIFQRQIGLLKQHELREEEFMPAIAKALQFRLPKDDKEKERAAVRDEYLKELISKYSGENGSNAYALLNVLTDFASRPIYTMTAFENNADTLERRVGVWMMKYVA